MAKVAFDVQGTLRGYYSDRVVKLFKFLQARGHDMYIWSFGGYSMANEARRSFKLEATPMSKVSRNWGDESAQDMDVCVDDEWNALEMLSAKKMIDVAAIPADESQFETFVQEYGL